MAQYIELKQDEIDAITSRYGLEVTSYQPIDEGAGNTNYLLRVKQDNYVLTVFEIEHSRVVNLVKLLGTLEAHAFPTTRILKSSSGEAVPSCRGRAVLIKPYIPGQVMLDLDEKMLHQVGAAMAKLHEIPPPDYLPEKHAYGLAFFPGVFGNGIDPGYEDWLAERYAALVKGISYGLPRGLIHGDVFYDNLLFDDGTFKALIDFEEACHYYRIFDLGMAAVGTCTENFEIRVSKVRALMDGYQTISALGEEEKGAAQLFIVYAATATSAWRFWKYHIDTPMIEKADKHYEMVRIAEHVSGITREAFMEGVFSIK